MRFSVPFTNVATGAVADTFTTIAALLAADTAGYRCRLRSISVGPGDDAPADLNVALRLNRVNDISGGGAGTKTAVTPQPKDSESRAAVIAGGHTYTVEPTTYETVPIWDVDMNRRNTIVKEWSAEDAPVINRDQLLGLLAAPRTAAAATLSGTLEFEEF